MQQNGSTNLLIVILISVITLLIVVLIYKPTINSPLPTNCCVSEINIPLWDKTIERKMESVLVELANTEDYISFAKSRNLKIKDNKVKVIIELDNNRYVLPTDFGIEESRYENLLQAEVPIDKLVGIASDPDVKFIRIPIYANTN